MQKELCIEILADFLRELLILCEHIEFSYGIIPYGNSGLNGALRLCDPFLCEHIPGERLLKDIPRKEESLELEGYQMSSVTLSHLTDKGAKS